MKRWQKTVTCPKCGSKNVLRARELSSGNIRLSVDVDRLRCGNCGEDLRGRSLPYPFGEGGEE